jgi:hypothetical protein
MLKSLEKNDLGAFRRVYTEGVAYEKAVSMVSRDGFCTEWVLIIQ